MTSICCVLVPFKGIEINEKFPLPFYYVHGGI